MKTKNAKELLRLLSTGLLVLLVSLMMSACEDSSTTPSSPPPGMGALLVGTTWADGINPESKITFTDAAHVILEGAYWEPISLYPTGQTSVELTYVASSETGATQLEPAVLVYTNAAKKTGFELWYYAAANGKAERLIVYFTGNNLQPREFYKE